MAFLGFLTFRHHVQEKQKVHVPHESSFLISPKFIDVVSRRFSTLDAFQECQIDDYLIVVGDWQQPGSLNSVIIKTTPSMGYVVRSELNKKMNPPWAAEGDLLQKRSR